MKIKNLILSILLLGAALENISASENKPVTHPSTSAPSPTGQGK